MHTNIEAPPGRGSEQWPMAPPHLPLNPKHKVPLMDRLSLDLRIHIGKSAAQTGAVLLARLRVRS